MIQTPNRIRSVIAAVAATLAVGAPGAAMMTRGPLPLVTIAYEAGRIVHGTVSDVRSGIDESGTPVTWVTFDVARTLKGPHAARVTIKQFGRSDIALGRIPGMPTYAPGEEVVVFLRPESRRGFTSPVGLDGGVYRVREEAGRRSARNGNGDTRPNVDAFLDDLERLVGSPMR